MIWQRLKRVRVADIDPGRRSIPEDDGLRGSIGRLSMFYDITTPGFPLEYLQVLEVLAIWNPDVSQALSILVNMGNAGHEVEIQAKNPDAALDRLNWLAGNVYKTGGGMDGLINHFFRQIPLMGALSGEWVIADRIEEGVRDVVIPPVRTIRFKYGNGEYRPYQYTGRGIDNTFVELNPLTFSYSPIMTMDGSPYAIPPFYAALKNIEVQLDAVSNIGYIIKKTGLLGFLDVNMEIPQQKAGESDESFKQRLQKRLKDYAAAYASNFSKGVAVHYKDQEIKHNSVGATASAGAKSIFNLNEEQICSALDIPPSMMGRSYSTTETYAEVDFKKLMTRITNIRRITKRFIEKGYELDLLLRGMEADVTVHFNEGTGFKELERAQADGEVIDNVIKKRDAGFIDDDQAARELGYDEATGDKPGNVPDWMLQDQGGKGSKTRFKFDRESGKYRHRPDRLYLSQSTERMAHSEKEKRVQNCVEALTSVLEGAEDVAIVAAVKAAQKDYRDETAFANAVYQAFSESLVNEIPYPAIDNLTDKYVEKAWQRYRYEDNSFLQAQSSRLKAQRARLGIVDENALRYLRAIDRHYFGSGNYLANHKTVSQKFIKWLEGEYVDKGLNIKDQETIKEFERNFSGLVKETSRQKINQLVDTSMGRIQNFGQTLKLYETGYKRFRIVGPTSGHICGYCASMVGRVFDVEKAATRLSKVVSKGFEDVDDLPPFLPNAYTVDEVGKMTDEQLQDAGFESPPYHPECRHRKAAED
ncbi:MAG: hypothetical protein HY739_12970 [Desulfobacterales bacterium]|nr:hypothetical protein [Desulfobacterales bacterium]